MSQREGYIFRKGYNGARHKKKAAADSPLSPFPCLITLFARKNVELTVECYSVISIRIVICIIVYE